MSTVRAEQPERPVAVVTGAGGVLGSAIAAELFERGARVAALDLDGELAGRAVASLGTEAIGLQADVTDEHGTRAAMHQIEEALGPIDVVVNNAGLASSADIVEVTRQEWDRVLEVNLTSMLICTQAVLPSMIGRRSGCFVNIASLAGKRGGGILGRVAYATSKAGVLGFTKSVARETARYGIRANAVAPGAIDAGMGRPLREDEQLGASVLTTIPLGRFGSPGDVARAVAFLAGADAEYLTGETLVVDGGIYMG